MTGGWFSGPNGARFWAPYAFYLALGVAFAFVNTASVAFDMQRHGHVVPLWEPVVWEFSSTILLAVLAPFIGLAVIRYPLRGDRWPILFAGHAAGSLLFSVLHVAGMVGLRKLAYAGMGEDYDFARSALGAEFFYEYRKDLLSYAIAVVFFAAAGRFADREEARASGAPEAARIEIKDGAKRVFLAPADILWVEAAGNYVEVHTEVKTHLVRGALSAYEARLAPHGFARVHRSRIVNRARIRAIETTASGDLTLTLDGGAQIAASRRFRSTLDAKTAERVV